MNIIKLLVRRLTHINADFSFCANLCNLLTITCLLAILPVSCVHHTDSLFDKPPAERIAESLEKYRDLLTAQTNGWIVEYYPEKTQKYGGFNLYFHFEFDYVTVRSEINPAASATSSWSMGTDMGPTINFDTYNAVLHFFSDLGIHQGGGRGLNYEGDYEFVVENGSEKEFILRGKKTKNIIRMTPLPANLSWEEYIQSLESMKSNVIAPAYRMMVNGREISIAKSFGVNSFILKSGGLTITAPFIVTLTGIRFYEPITFFSESLQVLTYNAAEEKLVSENSKSEISFVMLPLSNFFTENLPYMEWFLKSDNIGQGLLPAWNTIKSNLENNLNENLYAMWLGRLLEDFPVGITFASWDYENDRPWYGTYAYDFYIINDNQIRFSYNNALTRTDGINAEYYAPELQYFTIDAFNGKTFTLEPDIDVSDPRNMTKIKEITLRDVQNSENWLKVILEEVIWP